MMAGLFVGWPLLAATTLCALAAHHYLHQRQDDE